MSKRIYYDINVWRVWGYTDRMKYHVTVQATRCIVASAAVAGKHRIASSTPYCELGPWHITHYDPTAQAHTAHTGKQWGDVMKNRAQDKTESTSLCKKWAWRGFNFSPFSTCGTSTKAAKYFLWAHHVNNSVEQLSTVISATNLT